MIRKIVDRLIKESPKQKQSKECYRCGGKFQMSKNSAKKGHRANKCRSKRKTSIQNSNKSGNTHRLEKSEEAEEECKE